MSVFVRKSPSVLVRPLEPSSISTTIKLSSFDKGLEKMPATALLMFEHPIHEVANTIKRALSQALVHYYPIAGRIVAGAIDGEVHIKCNGEGVAFVSASANCALKDVVSLDRSRATRTLLDDLVLLWPDTGFGPTDPLFLIQVTEFSCSGFVLGVTWNHAIADGVGMAQFLQAIGELACGLSTPSVVPVRWDASLPSSLPSSIPLQQLVMSLEPLNDLACLEITVPSRTINRIKSEFSNRFPGEPSTKFDVVSAVLWQCRTRAIMCNPEAPVLFLYAANVRKHFGTKQGYYGNCTRGQRVVTTSGSVANGDILDLVRMIKHSKQKIADLIKNNEGSSPQQAAGHQKQELMQLRYNMLMVSSWGNLGFEEADFGSGTPARVTSYGKSKLSFPVCIMCLPWKAKDGVNVLSSFVKEEHVDAFLGELARFT